MKEYALAALEWIEGLGFVGYAVFAMIYAIFTVLFLPGFILTVGGGAVFGVVGGFIAVSVGSTVGACVAFLLGRFFARGMIEARVAGNARFAAIDRAVGARGWKIVFLTRLSPIFPFNLINYAYGLTNIPFWHYALASWIGMMPGTLLYVYIGAIAGDAAAAAAGTGGAGPAEWAMRIVGLIATAIVTVYITMTARKALNDAVPATDGESHPGDGVGEART
ncbi:MAG: TVP38/TMEM64 family protein [Candidatus Sumerlaeia bacterium]|nr:TVP38/TMEM64 family protein [Candidatus Sumerlaeia bacterium]